MKMAYIIKSSTPKNITLVLGLDGSHKRDLIQFISGNEQSNNSLDGSTFSDTKFPGLTVDTKTNTAFYEYPEFDRSKTLKEKISATLVLNKIVDYADSIKLIFAIPESQNKSGLDDGHINSLIDESAKIIENFDKLENSIALVVTKVDNFIDDKENLVSDEVVIKSIADSLIEASKKYSLSNEPSSKKKQNLINILLRKKDEMHTNIGIFKKPKNFGGKVSESQVLQDNKSSFEMMINVNTKFTKIDKNNFPSATCLDKLMNDLQTDLSNNAREIKQNVLNYFENQENESEDLEELNIKYLLGTQLIQELIYDSSNKNMLTSFLMRLKNESNIVPENIIRRINNYAENVKLFLQISSLKQSKNSNFAEIDSPKEHLSILTGIVQDLTESQAWYLSLISLRDGLNNHKIQEAVKSNKEYKLKIKKLHDKAASSDCDVDGITEDKREKSYDNIKKNISEIISDIFIDADGAQFHLQNTVDILNEASIGQACQAKLNILSKMLDSLFYFSEDDMHASCSDGIFQIEGQFVKLSDVSQLIKTKCKKPVKDEDTGIKEIRLFASNRVFIDSDFHMTGDDFQLSVIAPTWEVLGKRKIVLDGKPGESHQIKKALAPPQIPGHSGKDGEPGKPGGPAGIFLGIGSEFIHGENLNISLIGGIGGPGQAGSDGIDGTYELPSTIEPKFDIDQNLADLYQKCTFEKFSDNRSWRLIVTHFNCRENKYRCKFGGHSGKGGAGGKGGKTGKFELIELGGESKISNYDAEGPTGKNGVPGIPGKAGKGKILHFRLGVVKNLESPDKETHYISKKRIKDDNSCSDGLIFKSYFNSKNIESPKSSDARISGNVINDYKGYLRSLVVKKSEKVRGKMLRDFLKDIEKNQQVKELYHAKEFADELKSLETQFYKLHKKLSFLPFYESLLNRITEYADWVHQQRQSENYDTHEKIIFEDESEALRYLYAATLSKIYNIRNNKSSNLILDIIDYLDSAVRNINELNDYTKIVLMDEAHTNYYDSLNKKIKEAQDFGPQIMKEIKTVFDNVEAKIEMLINEVESAKGQVGDQMANLEATQTKLKNAMLLKSIFAIPKIIGTFLNFAGPVGVAAGAALTGSAMVIESLSFRDVNKDNIKAAKLSSTFNKNMKAIEKLFDQQEIFQAQLDAIVGAFNTTEQSESAPLPQSVLELKKTLLKMKKAVEEEKEEISPEKISDSIDKVTELLQKQAEELGDEKYKDDKSIQSWSKCMDRAVNVIKVVQVPVNVYKGIAADNEKNDLVIRAYKESEDQLKKLDIYKKNIQNNIIPQCRKLQEFLNTELSGENITRKNSLAALDISQWKMQDILKDLKNFMHKITAGFEVQEDIRHLMEKIDRAIITMIDIYDRIQDYRDKKELADYIRNVNPISSDTEIKIRNEELRNAINELKVIIQSNIVLEEYERVIQAVKQTVYPLASYYLDRHQFQPFTKSNSSNIISFADDAAKHLKEIQENFRKNRATVDDYDGYIMTDEDFIAEDNVSRGAFYTWRYAENKHAISQLLRGEKVTLKSDITRGLGLPAIKFRQIGINFKFANATVDDEKYFKGNLTGLYLTMKHLGDSQYQCNDKFHTITNDEQLLVIKFGSSKGNMVLKKLKETQALLSPYTSWQLWLSAGHQNHNHNFYYLSQYENMTIDLALEGSGDYLISTDERSKAVIDDICNGNLSHHYNEDKTILRISHTKADNKVFLDEIPGLSEPIVEDQKYHSRKRRSLADREFEQDVEIDLFSTSGAGSMKPSFINNIFNLIGSGLVAYEYLNPVSKIRQWFAKDEINIHQEDSFVLNSNNVLHTSMKMLNVPLPEATELSKVSKMFIDDELPTVNDLLIDSSICNHGNLLLLDLLIRSKSGMKYSHESIALNANVDPIYAQNLAYREHLK